MTGHEYLTALLTKQRVRQEDLAPLQQARQQIENDLRRVYGAAPRFYYAGSYGKGTLIRASFDLDLVIYFPPESGTSLRDLFNGVHGTLLGAGYVVEPKTVALRLPYEGGFHVDVVPGRAQDATYRYATLFKNTQPQSTLQTSLKVHIDAVRKSGLADVVKLLKLWRLRHKVPLQTIALEILVARALAGQRNDDLAAATWRVFQYVQQHIAQARLQDPANTNNVIEVSSGDRLLAAQYASATLARRNWSEIVW